MSGALGPAAVSLNFDTDSLILIRPGAPQHRSLKTFGMWMPQSLKPAKRAELLSPARERWEKKKMRMSPGGAA